MVSIIIDDELLLRTLQPADAQELFTLVHASREHLRPWLPWVDVTTDAGHSMQFIHQSIVNQNNQSGMALGIVYKGRLIGSMGMHNWDHALKKAQLGYWIAKEYQGRGVISACLKGFIGFLFGKVGLNKIEIQFIVSNKRSAAVAERLGFKVEGILRQSYILNGNYHDIAVTGMLKTEWVLRNNDSAQPFVKSI